MSPAPSSTAFHDLDAYLALPRLSGLVLSPDGTRLVTTVATLDADSTAFHTALWELDPTGSAPARRLTRGAKGESGAAFTSNGDLLFTAARPDPSGADKSDDEPASALWRLAGGEAELLSAAKGGITGVRAARSGGKAVLSCSMLPSATGIESDDLLRKQRSKKKVSAILHSGYPVRFWDSDLGPAFPHLMIADLAGATAEVAGASRRVGLTDLSPSPGAALHEAGYDISADGSLVVSTWDVAQAKGAVLIELSLFDTATGERTVLVSDPGADLLNPVFSPDGSAIAYLRESISTPTTAPTVTLHVIDLADRTTRQLAADWDRWANSIGWLPDASGLLLTADDDGRSPIFQLDFGTGQVVRLTDDPATFTDLQIAPDGSTVFAVRVSYRHPPHVVSIPLTGAGRGTVTALPGPSPLPELPGSLTEISTTTPDGATVRAWLALPPDTGEPAPLLLWIHGGPLNSWNAWSWRWNPWLMVAAGYAVLLPDPALSTGYGQAFIQRGWGAWGAAPYTDLMAITDAATERQDIDATRTAAMGGSFGGYMANWVAGHTDRFRAIVTHASLWALEGFGATTDAAYYWAREMTPEMTDANSPHRFVDKIVTPMLVIHGDRDYRVPIGEGLRLWYELISASPLALDDNGVTPHRLLYYPDENHWVLTPQNAKVWYQVVLGFLAEHVLQQVPPALPETLG